MIKIEFKDAQLCRELDANCIFDYHPNKDYIDSLKRYFDNINYSNIIGLIKSITPYTPTQDQMLDREHILKIQGITKEQDEENQKEWQCK